MPNTFRPNPFGAVLFSAVILGLGNAVLVGIVTAATSLLVPGARIGVGQMALFAIVTGLGASVAIALADRPMTYVQHTDHPHGFLVAASHLLAPLLVGALVGWASCGTRWFLFGGACALLAYLVQFFLLTPWKKTVDDEDMNERAREFAAVTRQYVTEYKEDIGELTRQKAQRKHDKNQQRLTKQRESR